MENKLSRYAQTEYAKFENDEAMDMYQSLTGESKEYIDIMAQKFLANMKEKGAKDFGIGQAREVVVMMIAKGFFVPKI